MSFRCIAVLTLVVTLSNSAPVHAQSADELVLQHIREAEAAREAGHRGGARRAVRDALRVDAASPRARLALVSLERRLPLEGLLRLDVGALSSILATHEHANDLRLLAHVAGAVGALVGAGALAALIPADGYTLGPNPLAASLGPSSPRRVVPGDPNWGFGSLGLGVLALALAAGSISLHIDACELNGTVFDQLRVRVGVGDGAQLGFEGAF